MERGAGGRVRPKKEISIMLRAIGCIVLIVLIVAVLIISGVLHMIF